MDKELHPSRCLDLRFGGYGIGAGLETEYRESRSSRKAQPRIYAALAEGGYVGPVRGSGVFPLGQAGFDSERNWFDDQFGVETSSNSRPRTM